jgi:hypothetical protein
MNSYERNSRSNDVDTYPLLKQKAHAKIGFVSCRHPVIAFVYNRLLTREHKLRVSETSNVTPVPADGDKESPKSVSDDGDRISETSVTFRIYAADL